MGEAKVGWRDERRKTPRPGEADLYIDLSSMSPRISTRKVMSVMEVNRLSSWREAALRWYELWSRLA